MRWLTSFSVLILLQIDLFRICVVLPLDIASCDVYFSNLSIATASAYSCFISHSQPVSLCGQCRDFMDTLQQILEDNQTRSDFNISCVNFINTSSDFAPLKKILPDVIGTWQSSHCESCLIKPVFTGLQSRSHRMKTTESLSKDLNNHTIHLLPYAQFPVYNYSSYNNATLQFFTRLSSIHECISSFIPNVAASILDPVNFPPISLVDIESGVCNKCLDKYTELNICSDTWFERSQLRQINKLADLLDKAPLTTQIRESLSVCADVIDALNRTQYAWFHMLNCTRQFDARKPAVTIVMSTGFLLIFFHFGLLCCYRDRTQMIIYRPSRVEAATVSGLTTLLRNDSPILNMHDSMLTAPDECPENMPNNLSVNFRERKFALQSRNFSSNTLTASQIDNEHC